MTFPHAPQRGAVSHQCEHALQLLPASMLVAAPRCVGLYSSHGGSPNSMQNISKRHSAYMAASSRAAQVRRLMWAAAHWLVSLVGIDMTPFFFKTTDNQ